MFAEPVARSLRPLGCSSSFWGVAPELGGARLGAIPLGSGLCFVYMFAGPAVRSFWLF